MLVLTRREGEEVIIGGNVRVRVIRAKGGQVQLGFTAPKDISVDRAEIHHRKEQERLGIIPVRRGVYAR